jgi:UDPglucose--hexose-1-phosphate uridylyltransferase
MIRFRIYKEKALLHNPLSNFDLEEQPIEYRIDPLTGFTSTFHYRPADSPVIFETDESVLENLTLDTEQHCLFCADKIGNSAPKFSSELFPEGRLTRGEATMFPNLFAQKSHSAVIVLTRKHIPRLNELTPGIFHDAFKLADRYIRNAYKKDGVKYAEIGQNYLYTSGSSVPHPHIQAMVSHYHYYLLKVYLEKAQKHYQKYKSNYWDELLKKEKRIKTRYIGSIGTIEWIVPFAPGRHDEINFIVPGKSNFLEFENADWKSLADGLSRVLQAYHNRGLSAFNFAMYSAPLNKKLRYFWAGGKIVSRSSIQTYPTSDIWYGPIFFTMVSSPDHLKTWRLHCALIS